MSSQTQHSIDATERPLPPGLYIVATPIGNLRDITLRALDTLKCADLIACEDTRMSLRLLQHYGIRAKLISYNDHNGQARRPEIMTALQEGQRVALISDAGTPLVSDPGYKLVADALAAGFYVTALPGASSVLAALCLAGLPTDRFAFIGFLPVKTHARRTEIDALKHLPMTLVFFESARRLEETLAEMADVLGDRPAAVVREITKLFEESRRATLKELAAHYRQAGAPKGEVVLVIGPPLEQTGTEFDIDMQLALLLASHSVKEAAAILAEQTGLSRREIYARALKHKSSDA